jgi:PAB1-binding protein PBP1
MTNGSDSWFLFFLSFYSSNIPRSSFSCSGFRTDTDISSNNASGNPKERELQQWQPEPSSTTAASLAALQGDEATFGVPGVYSAIPWDQFEVNERLFGVNPKFDEEAYTTKLDRSAPGYKEKERKAEQIANEIISVCPPLPVSVCSAHIQIFIVGYDQQSPRC